jgi:hypothetical protein
MEILIHYGSINYQPELVKPIQNDNWVKPKGGLWTSPVNSQHGWKDWCESSDFRECREENSFKLLPKPGARIFKIDSLQDLINAPSVPINIGSYKNRYLNFELLAKGYDMIWLTEKGQYETHLSYPINLYGRDCETVLIMNPYSCTEVQSLKQTNKL